mmetsp:Transcript_26770/g.64230  ORF Transcript_26770/g.64230 Transcript_26770/m.64230 type:complete len:211 (+) Transcript_26770:1364-1996(+)
MSSERLRRGWRRACCSWDPRGGGGSRRRTAAGAAAGRRASPLVGPRRMGRRRCPARIRRDGTRSTSGRTASPDSRRPCSRFRRRPAASAARRPCRSWRRPPEDGRPAFFRTATRSPAWRGSCRRRFSWGTLLLRLLSRRRLLPRKVATKGATSSAMRRRLRLSRRRKMPPRIPMPAAHLEAAAIVWIDRRPWLKEQCARYACWCWLDLDE